MPTLPRHGPPVLSATFRKSAAFKFPSLIPEIPPAIPHSRYLPAIFVKFAFQILHISRVSVRDTCPARCNNLYYPFESVGTNDTIVTNY
jgi:hypothetical protein